MVNNLVNDARVRTLASFIHIHADLALEQMAEIARFYDELHDELEKAGPSDRQMNKLSVDMCRCCMTAGKLKELSACATMMEHYGLPVEADLPLFLSQTNHAPGLARAAIGA